MKVSEALADFEEGYQLVEGLFKLFQPTHTLLLTIFFRFLIDVGADITVFLRVLWRL